MFGLTELKQTRVYQEAQQEEAAKMALRQLNHKLGSLPIQIEAGIPRLPLEQIEALGEALLDFGSLSDLERWLEQGSMTPPNN